MNFDIMPELRYHNSYFICLGVMFLIGACLFAFFVSKGWLKKKDYTNKE